MSLIPVPIPVPPVPASGPTTTVTAAVSFAPNLFNISYTARLLMIVVGVLDLLLGVLLLWAGIAMLRRQRVARVLHLRWAIAKLPVIALGVIAQHIYMNDLFSSMAATTPGSPALPGSISLISAIFGAVFSLAYPVFLLITLTRPSVRASIEGAISR
ncbi:MAG: hypothetical protein H7144_18500 [Burkholderiales bacterium]|nr:hypothetical protein [Phycisphaerae bacterium]